MEDIAHCQRKFILEELIPLMWAHLWLPVVKEFMMLKIEMIMEQLLLKSSLIKEIRMGFEIHAHTDTHRPIFLFQGQMPCDFDEITHNIIQRETMRSAITRSHPKLGLPRIICD